MAELGGGDNQKALVLAVSVSAACLSVVSVLCVCVCVLCIAAFGHGRLFCAGFVCQRYPMGGMPSFSCFVYDRERELCSQRMPVKKYLFSRDMFVTRYYDEELHRPQRRDLMGTEQSGSRIAKYSFEVHGYLMES